MQNKVPQSIPMLVIAAHKAVLGSGLYGAALPLLQNTQANINVDLNALTDSIMAHGTGKTELAIRRETSRITFMTSREFLTLGRDNFKPALGSEYNQSWDNTGLINSLSIPRTPDEVMAVLLAFKGFLTANPALEVPGKEITPEKASDLFTLLNAAVNGVATQQGIVDDLMAVRDANAKVLSTRLSNLMQELHMRMGGLDGRWLAFGLNKPGALESPEDTGPVTATLIGPNVAALKWNAVARAEYYHVFKRVQGVDTEFILVGSPADLDFNLENLPAGSHIDIVVAAVNNGGEGARSQSVTLVTH